jgi:hypothetical protein
MIIDICTNKWRKIASKKHDIRMHNGGKKEERAGKTEESRELANRT